MSARRLHVLFFCVLAGSAHAGLVNESGRWEDYAGWAQRVFAPSIAEEDRDPAQDPDGDGISNLSEFAMGQSPTSPDSKDWADPVFSTRPEGGGLLRWVIPCNPGAAGIDWVVESSGSLTDWESVSVEQTVQWESSTRIQRAFECPFPDGDGPVFYRFGVVLRPVTEVDSVESLKLAVAMAEPGDVIALSPGEYSLGTTDWVISSQGTPDNPILIQSRDPLGATLSGNGQIAFVNAKHLIFQGFRIRIGAINYKNNYYSGAIHMENCQYVRFSRNDLILDETASTTYSNRNWVAILGGESDHNRIDYNYFGFKEAAGSFVIISGSDALDRTSLSDRVDHNHFEEFLFANDANGYESIRLGTSEDSNLDRKFGTLFDSNRLVNCSGEVEIFSIKAGSVGILRNTLLNCYGAITLRCGNDSVVAYNDIRRTDPLETCGGIKIYGQRHRVFSNVLVNLNATGQNGSLALMHGAPAGSGNCGTSDCLPAEEVEVFNNTWLDCSPLRIGFESSIRPLPPTGCLFANNLIVAGLESQPLVQPYQIDGVEFQRNWVFPDGSATVGLNPGDYSDGAWVVEDPLMVTDSFGQRTVYPAIGSPLLASGVFVGSSSSVDWAGWLRDDPPTIGAFEMAGSVVPFWPQPLSASEVGPNAEVDPTNLPPIIQLAREQVAVGGIVVMTPRCIDDHPSLLHHQWSQISGSSVVIINGADGLNASILFPENGSYTFELVVRDGDYEERLQTQVICESAGTAETFFGQDEDTGLAVIEAENSPTGTATTHHWDLETTADGFSGTGYMQVLPATGAKYETDFELTSPRLDFPVLFKRTGLHYLWIRGYVTSGADDSCHAGMDGVVGENANRISGFSPLSAWSWCSQSLDGGRVSVFVPTTGIHTIHVWMREPGFRIDQLILTPDLSFIP